MLPSGNGCGQQHRAFSSSNHQAHTAASPRRMRRPRHHNARTHALGAGAIGGVQQSCVVVGGGIGGLVTAAKLAQSGYAVTLCEQGSALGGRCATVALGPFRFDTGPSLLLLPQYYASTFEWLGSSLDQHVQLARVEPAAYRVWFPDSSRAAHGGCFTLDLLYDAQAMVAQLEAVQAGAGTQYLAWLSDARKALVLGSGNFIARDFEGWGDFLDPGRLLPLLTQLNVAELLGSHHSRLARRFKDPRIAAMLSFQDLYVGLSPYEAPGVFSLLAATEITDGVYYPLGGFQKVVDGLVSICRQYGVDIRTDTPVAAIRSSSGVVTGVQLQDGAVLPAATVVTNRDVSMSWPLLVDEPRAHAKQRQLAAKQYSAGVVAFYWCLSKRLDKLSHHNVFLSGDYKASWRRAKAPGDFVRSPNFYVAAPSRTDPTAAPADGDSIMVLLPVANIQQRRGDDDYAQLVAAGRQLVLRSMQAAGVGIQQQDIVQETVREPAQWRQLHGLEHGAAFGMSHGLTQLALLRPGAVDPGAPRGLFFVGASSRPGNGVPLVMLGAQQTAKRILRARA